METYSVELGASLGESFDTDTLVLRGREDGLAPGLLAYGWFLLKAMAICLLQGRVYRKVVFCDLVMFPAAVCHWLVARRARRIVVVYGLDLVYRNRKGLLPLLYSLFFASFRACQAVFSSIVAISNYTARLAVDAGLRHVVVVNPSLPNSELVNAPAMHGEHPEPWLGAPRRILYFGRLVPRKGALWFAEKVLPILGDGVAFFVVGQSSDTDYRTQLERCARTHLLGRMDSTRLAGMIRAADIVVMPNIPTPESVDVEGFGLAAIEASALGGRLLASRLDGIQDAVIDGVTGTLVEPADVEAWATAVTRTLALAGRDARGQQEAVARATRTRFAGSVQARAFEALLGGAESS